MHLYYRWADYFFNIQSNWWPSCKKGVYSILGRLLFFCRIELNFADWLVLTWKALLQNCFCCFGICFWQITYAKNSVFKGYFLEIFCWMKNKSLKPFVLLYNEVIKERHLPLVVGTHTSFIIHTIMLFSYCCFISTSK